MCCARSSHGRRAGDGRGSFSTARSFVTGIDVHRACALDHAAALGLPDLGVPLKLSSDDIDRIITTPQAARVRCYPTAGKDHYQRDRAVGDRMRKVFPTATASAPACNAFECRAVAELARRGAEQFLIVGPGYEPQAHIIIDSIRPTARIIYADNDPIVVAHGTALHSQHSDQGQRLWLSCDPTGDLLDRVETAAVIDLRRPVVVSLVGTTEYSRANIPAVQLIRDLTAALAPGSALVLCQTVVDFAPKVLADVRHVYESSNIAYTPRPLAEFESFFTGLEVLDPGIVPPQEWHPDGTIRIARRYDEVCRMAGIGIKRQLDGRT
ncbi:SAM-dependent methyltransferase [Nocardia jiangxiensis]|uniref:SAM-dependent methyltransferase n=1 Tax=Nocardia jiangxiensis TaxID=282685 RepID=A0ABW6S0Z8_9NOCA